MKQIFGGNSNMAGTREGGIAAAKKNQEREPNFYQRIGRKGGKVKVSKGFGTNSELARTAGAKGGRISKRGSKNED